MEQYEHILWQLIDYRSKADEIDSPKLCELFNRLILSVAELCGIEV